MVDVASLFWDVVVVAVARCCFVIVGITMMSDPVSTVTRAPAVVRPRAITAGPAIECNTASAAPMDRAEFDEWYTTVSSRWPNGVAVASAWMRKPRRRNCEATTAPWLATPVPSTTDTVNVAEWGLALNSGHHWMVPPP